MTCCTSGAQEPVISKKVVTHLNISTCVQKLHEWVLFVTSDEVFDFLLAKRMWLVERRMHLQQQKTAVLDTRYKSGRNRVFTDRNRRSRGAASDVDVSGREKHSSDNSRAIKR